MITNIVKPSIKIFIGGAFVPIKYTDDIDTIIGSVNIVIILTNAVYEIDSAVSPLDILVNPYGSSYAAGNVEIRAMSSLDIGIRHPESFAVMKDALTA